MAARYAVLAASMVALLVASGCSDDEAPTTRALDLTTTSAGPTSTTEPGAPPTTLFPNTGVTAGEPAILTGTYETAAMPEPESSAEGDEAVGEDSCHLLRTDDGDVVIVSFSDLYVADDGTNYPGPPDYEGNPEDYETDAALAHPGERLVVRGEVAEVDDPCTGLSSHGGLVLLVEAWARP